MPTHDLVALLDAHMEQPLTPELAFCICSMADELPALIAPGDIARIEPARYREFTYAVERIVEIVDEIKPLHRAHWDETEGHRAGLPFNPDYATFARYERAGRYVLFTMRDEQGTLVGNCAMYLTRSAHTQTLMAREDTLYLVPQARRGRNAFRFVAYVERALHRLGAKEINITVKMVNEAGRFFRLLGYSHVEDGLTKILEA